MGISVLGNGAWGSALAIAFSHISPVKLWGRNHLQIENLRQTRTNPKYLPEDIVFPNNIEFVADLQETIGSELLIISTPVNAMREVLQQLRSMYPKNLPAMIWVSKGFELNSGLLPHQIVFDVFGNISDNVGALLGPSFAKEVAQGLPTAITLASNNLSFALNFAEAFCNIPNFRVYAHDDVIGSEVGAGVKNIMAIAVGISDGLNLGNNARAALITRSLSELSKLVLLLGGQAQTIYGLSGIGDLILTCTGDLSRNRRVGLELARGLNVEAILAKLGHVAEGVYALPEVYNLSKRLGIEMPIVGAVYDIIHNKLDIKQSVNKLLDRVSKCEFS